MPTPLPLGYKSKLRALSGEDSNLDYPVQSRAAYQLADQRITVERIDTG